MNDEVALLLLGALCAFTLLVLPLILVLVLWSKVSRLRTDVEVLQMKLRQSPPITSRSTAPVAAPARADVSAGEIEIVAKPPAAIPRSTPSLPPQSAPVESEAIVAPPVGTAHEKDPEPAAAPKEPFSLEEVLAGKWLTWVAALALIIGAGLFFKYSIENQWIDEKGRIAIGLVIGMAAFAGAAFAMLRDYRWFGQSLAGAAAGILYFSLYAGYGFYNKLIPLEAAFGGMALVTVLLLAFSTIFNAQSTAIIGLIGGFLTPLMLSQGVDRQWELFAYIFLLDLGVLGIASFRLWQPLQITAFVFTLLIWLGWFNRFYEPEKLQSTLILMTAFFLLFALLGVWHNALRRLPARGGDLFLMMATPIVYFIALYAVTKDQFETWHGLMAVGLAAVYVALGAVHLKRNPAGKMTVLALGGIAASFITVAVPLQLTGHWIAIAWAAESLLLVELGLKFQQPKLRWAGFGLLCVVQLILLSYTLRTIDDPQAFTTRLMSTDPGADFIPGVAGETAPAMMESTPSWADVLNGRSLSFLASSAVLAILAWEYRRRNRKAETNVAPADGWLMAFVPVTLLAMLSLETFVLGYGFDWSGFTVVGAMTAWASVAALALAAMALYWGPRWLERVAFGMYAVVGLLMIVTLLTTLGRWSDEWSYMTTKYVPMGFWRWGILNPRGLGFVAAITSAVAAGMLYARNARRDTDTSSEAVSIAGLELPQLLGVFAHLSGLVMLTTEVYAQGVVRDWGTWTALSITIVWLAYAMATLVAGIYYRSATIRILALLLFAASAGKVFLYDVWKLNAEWKTAAFIALGVALMLVSYFYRRHRDRIRAWMQAASILGLALLILHGTPAFAQESSRPPLETLEYRWPLSAGQANGTTKLSGVTLPDDVYGVARDDFADLRVLAVEEATKSALDIPYVLVQPSDRVTLTDRSVELLNRSQTKDGTEFLIDLGENPQPIREISIDVATATHNFQRDVRVYGGDNRTETGALLTDDGLLLDVARGAEATRLSRLTFPRSQFRFYRVVIENGTEPPLTIAGARVADREETRAPRREHATTITNVREDLERHCTVVTADLGFQKLPTTAVRLELAPSGDFYRSAAVEAADRLDDQHNWRSVTSFEIHRIERTGRELRQSLGTTYSESRGRYLRITIFNGDDQPLTVQKVTAEGIDRWLAVERDELTGANRPVALFAGDPKRDAPQYDLARTAGEIRVNDLAGTATIGAQAKNEFYVGPTAPQRPWSEEHQGLVWGLTIGGVVLFGGLTALLLLKAASNGGATG